MKLTPEQKLQKQKRDNVVRLINRVKVEFSVKKIKTYRDFYLSIGKTPAPEVNLDATLTFPELKQQLDKLYDEAIKDIGTSSTGVVQQSDTSRTELPSAKTTSDGTITESVEDEEKLGASNNYGLKQSDRENVTLFWFQKLGAARILKNIMSVI